MSRETDETLGRFPRELTPEERHAVRKELHDVALLVLNDQIRLGVSPEDAVAGMLGGAFNVGHDALGDARLRELVERIFDNLGKVPPPARA